jgi:hypothetical protein
MSERPLHRQVYDFVTIWMRDKRDGEAGLNKPASHHGPLRGPRDWYIGMGMVGGLLGLIWSQLSTVGGLIGIAVGVGIVAVWNLVWGGVFDVVSRIMKSGDHYREENNDVHTVREDKDIQAYYKRKAKEKR